MEIIKGREIADEIKSALKDANEKDGISPCLAIIVVGDNKESLLYVGLKDNAVVSSGGKTRHTILPQDAGKDDVLREIKALNQDDTVDGILLQLPLPEHLQQWQEELLGAIDSAKDVDGFNPCNRGLMMTDSALFISCAALAILEVCRRYAAPLNGKRVLLVGDSFDLIQPLAIILSKKEGAVVIIIPDYDPEYMTNADIVIIEKGAPLVVKREDIKKGSLVIDAAFYYNLNHVCGNVDRESVQELEGDLLPVPGGMGPILIAKLTENLAIAARKKKL